MAWVKGQSGNPAGRPRGHKERFTAKFWADIHYAWEQHGPDAIDRLIQLSPDKFVQICASLQPKEEQRREIAHSIEITLREPQWLKSDSKTTQLIDITSNNNNDDT